jgi:hypothetical protein
MATPAQLEVNRLKNEIEETQENIRAFEERLQNPNLTALQRGTAQTNLDRAKVRLAELQTELAAAEATVASQPVPQPAPPATAGETVKDDAAKGPTAAPEQTVGTDGRVTTPATTGTNDPVKTTEQTQAITTNSNSGQPVAVPPTGTDPVATTGAPVIKPGVAAPGDDAASSSTATAVNANNTEGPNVKPRPNVLDEYASYSYSASVYLITQSQYSKLLNSSTKKVDGYQLLFQSGGAANNVGGIRPPPPAGQEAPPSAIDGGRNPFFDNDFYIDSIVIDSLPPGKGSGSAHNVQNIKFTVIEPNGITLLDRLYDAAANSAPVGADGKVNYNAVDYLMVIRFYGYDSEGNLQQVRSKPDQEGTSDPAAIVEKFIPFRIKTLNWSVGTRLVSYEWDCTPINLMMGSFTNRGTIPYDVQLVDSTVGGLLGSDAKYSGTSSSAANPGASTTSSASASASTNQSAAESQRLASAGSAAPTAATTPAPAKANAAPNNKTTVTAGLAGAMNEFQAKLVKDGIYTYADEYVIRFIGPDANKIRDAALQLPNTKVEKRLTAAGKNDPQSLDQGKTSVDMISRSFSITAGQQLLQAIDLTIRNSSYIRDQALVIINPDGSQSPNPNSRNNPLKWYVITMSAEPISPLDPKRNDRAYRITYSIAARVVKNVISKYFPVSKFQGVHKSYPYWFTGQNIAVLEYQESMNAMYNLTVSGSDIQKSAAAIAREKDTASMSDMVMYYYAPRSTESSQGAAGKENEIGANAAEVLYNPSDLRECKIKIVGDPAWIMQGSNFRIPTDEMFGGTALSTGFMPDGSIAFDNQDVLFEINWQRPEDYDLATGLADPYSQTQKKYNNRTALQSRVYLAKRCVSEFRHGAFTQTLEGVLYQLPVPSKANTANPAAAASSEGNAGEAEAQANQTASSSTTGANSATASDNNSRNAAAATDPRRTDSADGGSAAILGAQQNSAATAVPSVSTGGAGTATGVDLANTGVSGSGTGQLAPVGGAVPTTDSSGNTVAPAVAIGDVPPKIAADTSPDSPTNPANQQIVRES